MKRILKKTNIKNSINSYFLTNSKEYIFVILVFIIGILIGVMFINNYTKKSDTSITNYIIGFIENFKNLENFDTKLFFKNILIYNSALTILLWSSGTTILGLPIIIRNVFI